MARARRARRRAVAMLAVLSTAAAALIVSRLLLSPGVPPAQAEAVATIERLDGGGTVLRSPDGAARPAGAAATTIRPGDRIETGRSGRVALRLSAGASLRIDRGTGARFVSSRSIELDAGALYVDGGRDSADLEIHTPFGVVSDVGTQFEVRVVVSAMRVRVRSGLVEVRRGSRMATVRPGTELTIDEAGWRQRQVLPYGPEWEWAGHLAPRFAIEGRPLAAFLDHVCREQGWTLTYGDAALARESSGIILHGSVHGLEPAEAVAVALATAGLAHRFQSGELVITRAVPR
jgi:ferric-dicitrate binding protein FerR (iron transport regulator)